MADLADLGVSPGPGVLPGDVAPAVETAQRLGGERARERQRAEMRERRRRLAEGEVGEQPSRGGPHRDAGEIEHRRREQAGRELAEVRLAVARGGVEAAPGVVEGDLAQPGEARREGRAMPLPRGAAPPRAHGGPGALLARVPGPPPPAPGPPP